MPVEDYGARLDVQTRTEGDDLSVRARTRLAALYALHAAAATGDRAVALEACRDVDSSGSAGESEPKRLTGQATSAKRSSATAPFTELSERSTTSPTAR